MPRKNVPGPIPHGRDRPLIAVDVGNACMKLGRFDAWPPGPEAAAGLPSPDASLTLDGRRPPFDLLAAWLGESAMSGFSWWIGSVNRPAATALLDWLHATRRRDPITLLSSADMPLEIRLAEPDRVGVDRLLDAVAANALRERGRAAVVVDVGTAITVDLIAPDGAFCGGAIVPGIAMSARALHEFTDLLPLVDVAELCNPPSPLGTSTIESMRSGLFWFAVGAIRELAGRMTAEHGPATGGGEPLPPHLFLTGGAGETVASLLEPQAQLVPHLTLAGIALTARASTGTVPR